ncbi:MAG: Rpn family recombination-promoting nuclease/putative transposase [Treponema sp.]|nr:Rpn family recombination-promoting nuclease/putative transposase [Treponema sp.]
MNDMKAAQSWEKLTFANNFLFCKILENDKELCRQILELLLHIKIEKLEKPEIEKTMQESLESKSVRFDVYTKDDKRIFDIEMQTSVKKNLPKRARYYQSVIDMDNLSHGENYSKLKDTYVIFLCLNDIFGKNLPMYFFENFCQQNKSIKLNDRAFKVFFNASKSDKMKSDEEKYFFNFLRGEKANSDLTKKIEEKVRYAKKNAKWRKQFMTWQQTIDEEVEIAREEAIKEGLKQGLEQGLQQGLEQGAHNKALESALILKQSGIDTAIIEKSTGLSLSEIESL